MQTVNRNAKRFEFIKFTFIAAQVLALVTTAHAPAFASPTTAPDLLEGISFAGQFTNDDLAYLTESLQMLRDGQPDWWNYIAEATPLTLSIDLNEGTHGRAAIAKCCTSDGRGMITFGFHLGQMVDSTDPDSQTPEARRIAFLATLVHEVTHIRDQRAGKFLTKTDYKSCVAAEKSGLEKQLEVQQDLALISLGDNPTSAQIYKTRLAQQIRSESAALRSRDLWNQYCGAFL